MLDNENKRDTSWSMIVIKLIFFAFLCYLAFYIFTTNNQWIFLDYVNLVIHEAGHAITMFFGQFINVLGGSLLQILVPIVFLIYFFITKQYYSSGFCLFWLGDSLMQMAIYMKDAQARVLDLLGGNDSIHDWNWLFSQMGVLHYDLAIGGFFYILGALCLIGGLIFMGFMIGRDIISQLSYQSSYTESSDKHNN